MMRVGCKRKSCVFGLLPKGRRLRLMTFLWLDMVAFDSLICARADVRG